MVEMVLRSMPCGCCREFFLAGERYAKWRCPRTGQAWPAGAGYEVLVGEREWLATLDRDRLLRFFRRRGASGRKFRLYWEACRQPALLGSPGPVLTGPERARACELVHEVFGNPFRPVTHQPAWLDRNGGAAFHLAYAVAAEGRFGDLPVLADALEEAGCTDVNLLTHLRGGGPHVRGCWALDTVLGQC
jgi:hypothetical protein